MFSTQPWSAESEHPTQGPAPESTPALSDLDWAILQAVAYADVFGYPLTSVEVHRYLVGLSAPLAAVQAILSNGRLVPHYLTDCSGYFTLPGREALVETRRRRAVVATSLWPRAARYGQMIARLPFVRLVAVTGALAMDNVEPNADIDYLIITEPDRLWLCRALVIVLVRLAALGGDVLCPNYFLSERALVFSERNLFTAHELVQMTPVVGLATYARIRQLNTWTADFLPNAGELSRRVRDSRPHGYWTRPLTETILRTPIGGRIERWEMKRKVKRFKQQRDDHGEATFCADQCKGHFDGHRQRILTAFAARLRAFEQLAP
jgi:hypothetical protein